MATEQYMAGTDAATLRHFAFLVENTGDFIGMCDLDFRPFFVNKAGANAVALSEKPDATVFDFFFEEDRDFLRNVFFPRVLREGRATTEIRFKHFKTGRPVWMQYSVLRIDDASGCPTGYATISRDLSESKRSEDRLAHKRRILEMIARGAPLPETFDAIVGLLETHWPDAIASVMLVDDEGRLHVGAGAGLPLEYAAALEGLEIGPTVGSCGTAAFRREPVVVSDIEHDPLWDDYRSLALPHNLRACWSVPIVTSTDRLVGTIAVYYRDRREPHAGETDFATDSAASLAAIAIEKSLTEKELHEQARALAVANENKDEFLAKLAHELRNPLGVIQTALEMFKVKMEETSPLQRYRDVIDRQTRHMARLIDDLGDLSRIGTGKIELRRQRVDVAAVAADAAETVRPAAQSRQQQLEVVLPADPVFVEADPARLMQICVNLLNNAVKYTPQDGRIRLAVARADRTVSIRVRDNGMGIAPAMLPRVFDLYAQADAVADHAEGGLGIGLHLVQSLVRLHGGIATATSAGVGLGSEFEVRLPAEQ